jgi:hypothetical protein
MSTAAVPSRLARTRSRAVGAAALDVAEHADARLEPVRRPISSATRIECPCSPLSATTMMLPACRAPALPDAGGERQYVGRISGMRTSSAPPATPTPGDLAARASHHLDEEEACDAAVSRMRSIESRAVFTAVPKPIVKSVP